MSSKESTFKIERWTDLTGGIGKRKRYNEILRGFEKKHLLYFYYPSKITIKENEFGITDIIVEGNNQRKVFKYPTIKWNEYTFDEVGEYDLLGTNPITHFQICSNGLYFDNDSLISGKDPAYRKVGECYEFHNISLTLTHPVANMMDFMRRVNQLIDELKKFFECRTIFRFHNVLEVCLNILGIEMSEIKLLHIPDILSVEMGKVEMATTQLIDNITSISTNYQSCTMSNGSVEMRNDQPVTLTIYDDDCDPEDLSKKAIHLINGLQREVDFCNGEKNANKILRVPEDAEKPAE